MFKQSTQFKHNPVILSPHKEPFSLKTSYLFSGNGVTTTSNSLFKNY